MYDSNADKQDLKQKRKEARRQRRKQQRIDNHWVAKNKDYTLKTCNLVLGIVMTYFGIYFYITKDQFDELNALNFLVYVFLAIFGIRYIFKVLRGDYDDAE